MSTILPQIFARNNEGLIDWAGRLLAVLQSKFDQEDRNKKKVKTLGDGVTTEFTVVHNFKTLDVSVTVFGLTGTHADLSPTVSRPDENSVKLTFGSPPAANSVRLMVFV